MPKKIWSDANFTEKYFEVVRCSNSNIYVLRAVEIEEDYVFLRLNMVNIGNVYAKQFQ